MKTLPVFLLCLFLGAVARADEAAALPRLVDLGAKKCIPCKQMIPVLEALTTEYAGRLEVMFIRNGSDTPKPWSPSAPPEAGKLASAW